MNKEEIVAQLKKYPLKTVVEVRWDRGNGENIRSCLYGGCIENYPILTHYNPDSVTGISTSSDFFDILNPELGVISIKSI